MKKFSKRLLNGLHQRLMILLEHEPCDAVQTAYFDVLDEMRREMAADEQKAQRETEKHAVRAVRTVGGMGRAPARSR